MIILLLVVLCSAACVQESSLIALLNTSTSDKSTVFCISNFERLLDSCEQIPTEMIKRLANDIANCLLKSSGKHNKNELSLTPESQSAFAKAYSFVRAAIRYKHVTDKKRCYCDRKTQVFYAASPQNKAKLFSAVFYMGSIICITTCSRSKFIQSLLLLIYIALSFSIDLSDSWNMLTIARRVVVIIFSQAIQKSHIHPK